MKIKTRAFALFGRITWKVLATFGSRYARQKLANADHGTR